MKRNLPREFFKTTLKAAIPFFAFVGMAGFAQAQSGYNYKTVKSSNWNDITLWVRAPFSSPNSYSPISTASEIPNRNAGNIEILDGHTVTYDYPNNVDQIIIKAGGVFELPAGKSLSLYVAPSTDRMVVQGVSGKQGIFRNLGGTVSFTDGSTAVSSSIEVAAYGKYEHAYNASLGTIPTATWDANSDIEFKMTGTLTGSTLTDYQTRGYNQTFGNVKWNTSANTSNLDLKGVITNINGNFEVVSTGASASGSSNSALILSSSGTYNLAIGKSLIVSGTNSDLVFSTQGAPIGGVLNLTTGEGMQVSSSGAFRNNTVATPLKVLFTGIGNLQNSANVLNMNFEVATAANVTLTGDFTVGSSTATFLVNGTLKTANYAIKGSGNFSLATDASLNIGSSAGITASGLTGNIQVSGTRTYSGLANYIYNGTAAQVSGNGLPSNIKMLKVDNALGLTLSKSITTSNLLLHTGILKTTATNNLIMAASGIISEASGLSYVEGPMAQTVSTATPVTLTFPVGKNNNFRPVSLDITQRDATTTTYTAEQFEGAPPQRTLPGTIDKVSSIRYFSINQSPATVLTEGTVTLSFGSDDKVNTNGYADLRVAKSSGSSWLDLGNGFVGSGTISSGINFTTFSDFVLANKTGGTNPLPVELINFSAKAIENQVNLDWATATEKNNAHFMVERSADARNFVAIAQVEGAGNANSMHTYQTTDNAPLAGTSYYRLKQTDFDGTTQYSKIVSINLKAVNNAVAIFPNPVAATLNITGLNAAVTEVRIIDMLGQEILKKTLPANARQLDLGNLPNGTYQVMISNGSANLVKKVVKI